MQNNKLTKGAFAALLLASAVANADTQYPAADFQPSVVFQDEAYINGTQAAAKAAAPVATAPAATSTHAANDDAKYPAANFQPVVVFNDPNYVATPSKNNNATSAAAVTQEEAVVEAAPAAKKADDSSNYLFGLIGLAAVGFFLFKGQGSCPARKESSTAAPIAPASVPSGLTGVARYLNKKAGTGVARYLEKQSKTATTGVARYVAKQVVAKAKKETTGVEKYVRDRG